MDKNMKKLYFLFVLGVVLFVGMISFAFFDPKDSIVNLAIEKAMNEEFEGMAKKDSIASNTMVDAINMRHSELKQAFFSGRKKWPYYANPEDIARYATLGAMYREHLSAHLSAEKAECITCHNYRDLL